MGRAASGVRGIKLKGSDEVMEVGVVGKEDEYVMIVTQNGMGKISEISEYRDQNRGGSGVKAMNVTPKTGNVISAMTLKKEDLTDTDLLLMSK